MNRRSRILVTAGTALALVAAGLTTAALRPEDQPAPAPPRLYSLFTDADVSDASAGPENKPIEVGIRFSSSEAGQVDAVRFLRAGDDNGEHRVTVWSATGVKLASGDSQVESIAGWQEVALPQPVPVEAGQEYVVSYQTSRYRVSQGWFTDRTAQAGPLTTVGTGVYGYGEGEFPAQSFAASNYWVDLVFRASAEAAAPSGSAPPPALGLPRVPWEGGPAYYTKFATSDAGGWDSPAFFPIGVWYEGVQSQAEVDLDKDAGLNTYVMLTEGTDLALIARNGMHAMTADKRADSGPETTAWIINDEVDMWGGAGSGTWTGKYPGEGDPCASKRSDCGFDIMARLSADLPRDDGRMTYANFGKGVMFWQSDAEASKFVNDYTTVVSNDIYWYTDPNVCFSPSEGPRIGITAATCRRAANYGLTMDRMRKLDASDGRRQPVYAFVEVGKPFDSATGPTITGDQIAGAVVNSLIHEARGVLYFNHNFGGPCISQHVLRDACGARVRPAVTELNQRIAGLAEVLNTQSYEWEFNKQLDTMLKEHDGSYYVFAMPSRTGGTGTQKLTLPGGLSAAGAEVMFENRTVPISGGVISDTFAKEFSYHIYKIAGL